MGVGTGRTSSKRRHFLIQAAGFSERLRDSMLQRCRAKHVGKIRSFDGLPIIWIQEPLHIFGSFSRILIFDAGIKPQNRPYYIFPAGDRRDFYVFPEFIQQLINLLVKNFVKSLVSVRRRNGSESRRLNVCLQKRESIIMDAIKLQFAPVERKIAAMLIEQSELSSYILSILPEKIRYSHTGIACSAPVFQFLDHDGNILA